MNKDPAEPAHNYIIGNFEKCYGVAVYHADVQPEAQGKGRITPLLCFRHLSEFIYFIFFFIFFFYFLFYLFILFLFFFCLALYTEEVNLQTFVMIKCKSSCCNYPCMKSSSYSSHWVLKNQIFSLFPVVKMNAICQNMQKSVG